MLSADNMYFSKLINLLTVDKKKFPIFTAPLDPKSPRQILHALCDTFLLSHFLQIATRPSTNDLAKSLALTVRTWRAVVESRYIGKHFQDTQWTELSFIRTVASVSLKGPSSALHKFVHRLFISLRDSKSLTFFFISAENFVRRCGYNY